LKNVPQIAGTESTGPDQVLDVGSLFPLGTLCHFKADLLAFLEGLEAVHIDCRIVCKQILAPIIGRNETKTLCIVKPFNCTCCHDSSFFKKREKLPQASLHHKSFNTPILPASLIGSNSSYQVTATSIALFLQSLADLATVTLSMPSLNSAFTEFSSALSGNRKLRTKLPQERSIRWKATSLPPPTFSDRICHDLRNVRRYDSSGWKLLPVP
jgi:hypothetical protein